MSWQVVPTEAWLTGIRQDLDTALDLSVDYDGTADGAYTYVGAVTAGNTSQHIADAFSNATLATAPRAGVVSRALDRGLTPRAATFSTLTVALVTGAGGVLEVGTSLRVIAGTVEREDQDQGVTFPFPDSVWVVIENLQTGELLAPSDTVVIECTTSGRVTVTNPLDLEPVDAIDGVEVLRYSGGQSTSGRAKERDSELRARIRDARSNKAGTDPGLVTALRDELGSWLVAAGIESTLGHIRVTVAPPPPTDADEEALAQTIYSFRAGGAISLGLVSREITAADGQLVTESWDVGTTTDVLIGLTVTPADGVTSEAALSAGRDALRDVVATLGPGETLYWLDAFGSLRITALKGADLTLNGLKEVDVTPAPANMLVAVFP